MGVARAMAVASLFAIGALHSSSVGAEGDARAYAFLDERQLPPTVAVIVPSSSKLVANEVVALKVDGRSFENLADGARPWLLRVEATRDLISVLTADPSEVYFSGKGDQIEAANVTWVGWSAAFEHERIVADEKTTPLPLEKQGSEYVLTETTENELVRWKQAGELVLAPDDLPYLVDGTVTVPVGFKLIIEPGVRLQFAPSAGIRVQGSIIARGTPDSPIAFLPHTARGWSNISIEGDPAQDAPENEVSLFEYCLFAGGRGRRSKADQDDPLVVEPLGESNVAGGALLVYRKRVEILDSVFRDNRASTGGAVFIREGYSNSIKRSLFIHNSIEAVENPAGAGVRLYGTQKTQSHQTIEGNSFVENRAVSGDSTCGGGLFFGTWSAPGVFRNVFLGNSAINAGGAIYGYHGNVETEGLLTIRILQNLFFENLGGINGGNAIRFDQVKRESTISRNIFIGNRSLDRLEMEVAGTVTLEGAGPLKISRNVFRLNHQREGSAGVVILDPQLSELDIERNEFDANRSERAGTIEVDFKKVADPREEEAFRRRTLDLNTFSRNQGGDEIIVKLNGVVVNPEGEANGKVLGLMKAWGLEILENILKVSVALLLFLGFSLWFPEFVLILGKLLEGVPATGWLIQGFLAVPWMRVRVLGPYMEAIRRDPLTFPVEVGAVIESAMENATTLILRCPGSASGVTESVVRVLAEKPVKRVPVMVFGEIDLQKDNLPGAVAAALRRGIQKHESTGWRDRLFARLGISNTIVRTLMTGGALCVVAGRQPESESCFDQESPVEELYSRSLEYENSRFLALVCQGTEVEIENRTGVASMECPLSNAR